MTREQHRRISLVLMMILAIALFGASALHVRLAGVPMQYAGPFIGSMFLILAGLGFAGFNVWSGGPLDMQLDATAGLEPSGNDLTRIRALYMFLVLAGLGLMVMDSFYGAFSA